MTESATSAPPVGTGRAAKREQTLHDIVTAARRLAVEHGIDGFTMDDLAGAAGVSRRTLFNYVPGKDDAVIGAPPVIAAEVFTTFVAGGPHGSLVEDLAEIVVQVLRERPESPEEVALGRAAMQANPRLIAHALDRLQELVESCLGYVEQREGAAYDRQRFDVALTLVVACLHLAMDRFLTGDHGTDLAPLFLATLHTARDLLA
ncbi:TetR/AcrR family transcriptional regulator [Nocardioides aurantiacus]|uniref:TetR/AcrR family transcriptional regulator n=1 Tax=Nocardioides aurantiacus TaxID=86796 RepID=UPI0014777465|nr:TetR/AcrR family transcriptional regulator [Nocardioides aurantiacus]